VAKERKEATKNNGDKRPHLNHKILHEKWAALSASEKRLLPFSLSYFIVLSHSHISCSVSSLLLSSSLLLFFLLSPLLSSSLHSHSLISLFFFFE
jgi:hypothetical protein